MPNFFTGKEIVGKETTKMGSFLDEKVFVRGHIFGGNPTVKHIIGLTGPETVFRQFSVVPSATFFVLDKPK